MSTGAFSIGGIFTALDHTLISPDWKLCHCPMHFQLSPGIFFVNTPLTPKLELPPIDSCGCDFIIKCKKNKDCRVAIRHLEILCKLMNNISQL